MTRPGLRALVSVRSVEEALQAAAGGADFIDLKEPSAGALGGLPLATIHAIVAALRALRARRAGMPISATVGDLPMNDVPSILARVCEVGDCGVDYVKVGITREAAAAPVLSALSTLACPVVPVFIADQGLDAGLVDMACTMPFPALMVDTADKLAGSLFDVVTSSELQAFVAKVRQAGALVGLAGALRLHHVPALQVLAPDFAGFRSAVCVADRRGALDPARLQALVARLRHESGVEVQSG